MLIPAERVLQSLAAECRRLGGGDGAELMGSSQQSVALALQLLRGREAGGVAALKAQVDRLAAVLQPLFPDLPEPLPGLLAHARSLNDAASLESDQGWFWIVMMGSCAVVQMIAIGLAVLYDQNAEPIFPRWVGYINLWLGLFQIPGVAVPFFHEGPFAWNGLFAFWLPLTTFSAWIFVDTWVLLRAIRREADRQKALAA